MLSFRHLPGIASIHFRRYSCRMFSLSIAATKLYQRRNILRRPIARDFDRTWCMTRCTSRGLRCITIQERRHAVRRQSRGSRGKAQAIEGLGVVSRRGWSADVMFAGGHYDSILHITIELGCHRGLDTGIFTRLFTQVTHAMTNAASTDRAALQPGIFEQ
jgi:hypothetical protein